MACKPGLHSTVAFLGDVSRGGTRRISAAIFTAALDEVSVDSSSRVRRAASQPDAGAPFLDLVESLQRLKLCFLGSYDRDPGTLTPRL